MRASPDIAWEEIPGGVLIMHLVRAETLKLTGEAAAWWLSMASGGDMSPPAEVEQLRQWGAVTSGD